MRHLTVAAVLLSCSVALAAAPAKSPAPAPRPATAALAQKLVTESARVSEGDYVLITGTFEDRELLEDLAVAVRKVGGNPLVWVDSDAMLRRFYEEVPEKYDGQAGAVRRKLAESFNVRLRIDRGDSAEGTGDLPAARVATAHESFAAANAEENRRGTRRVVLGNGLFPTEQTARKFGLTLEQLSRIFWDGINVDNQKLLEAGEKARAALAKAKVLEITAKNGTSLKMRVEGRPVLFSDGVITPEELKKGGQNTIVWLPAGEVYLAPVPGTAEGTLVIDRQLYQGAEITGLTLTFKAGKLTSMTAKAGLEALKADYDTAPAGKDVFGFVDLGINPNVKVPPGTKLVSYLPAGMLMIALGGNQWAMGENTIVWALQMFLPEATVKLDGKALVEKGALKL